MSRFAIIPRRAIEDERFSMTHLRVLCALGTFTDKHGWCYPSASKLAAMVSVSRQRVSTCIGELSDWGYIEVHFRRRESDNGQTSNGYRVLFDIGEPLEEAAPLQPVVAPPATSGSCTPLQPLQVAPPATSGGCTKNVPLNAPPPLAGAGATVTAAGQACILMREAGLLQTNPSHPKLLAALAAGVTPQELADVATEYPGKPMTYVVATAHKRKAEGTSNGSQNAHTTGNGNGPVIGRAGGKRPGESLAQYVQRVNRQHDEHEQAATA